jgi:hypothetical protein
MEHQAMRNEARFDGFEIDASPAAVAAPVRAAMERQPGAPVRVVAPDAAAAQAQLSSFEGRPRAVRLESLDGVATLPVDVALIVATAAQLEAAAGLENPVEVELNTDTLGWLRAHAEWVRDKGGLLTLFPQVFLRLENARGKQVDLKAALVSLPVDRARLVNVPACLSGRKESHAAEYFATEELLREVEDVPAHARHYFFQGYLTKGARCAGCAVTDRCGGAHVNYVRQFGFAALEPIR